MKKFVSLQAVGIGTGLILFTIGCSMGARFNTVYSLTVNSVNPANGVSITVSQPDVNGAASGATGFARTYSPGSTITLTAPATAGGNSFSSWTGCTSSDGGACTVTVKANTTVTAAYVTPQLITPTVTVTPSPASITTAQSLSVAVSVSGGGGSPTPTGAIVLSSGTYASSSTTLSADSATITVPAGSLAVGADTLTATYTPDSASSATYTSATGTSTATVTSSTPQPTVTLAASPTSIASGGSSILTWTSTNATSCTASSGWSGTEATSGTESVTPAATTSYTLTCTGAGGSANASATVTVGPGWFTHIGCEGGTLGTQVGQGGPDEFTQTFSSTLYSDTEVGTGSESCQMGITQGSDGWAQWGAIYQFPTQLSVGDDLWIRLSLYVPSTFNYTASPWLKFMRVLTASPTNNDQGYIDLYIVPPNGTIWDDALNEQVATPFAFYYEGNAIVRGVGSQPANNIATDEWETYEIYYHLDTVSKDDGGAGEVRIWKDNNLLADLTDQAVLADSATYAEAFYLFTYWNGNAPATQSLYVDDVEITNQTPANTDANGYPFIGAPVMPADEADSAARVQF